MSKIILVCGLPGSGKTTFGKWLEVATTNLGWPVKVISMDDYYLPSSELDKAMYGNPWNVPRGLPGSHSIELLEDSIDTWLDTGDLHAPQFDKALREGRGDRCGWQDSQPKILVLEGWFLGCNPKKISLNQMEDDKFISNVSIQNLLSEIIRSFEEISEKRIYLNLDQAKKEVLINRSPEITYGIRNFVGNAVKYSKSEVKVDLYTSSDKVRIKIIDNGPGFPDDIFSVIGQPYISSKSAVLGEKSGLGLGTFIGKTLLERQKAFLNFSNLEKGGAMVNIDWNTSDIII